ncbi:MAG: hypothetical protein ACW96U_00035 [Candidatus Heimdallarchaeaceae archaeon]|jgi:hypothetical protein
MTNRIRFNQSASPTNAYECTYNPVSISVPQSVNSEIRNSVETIDGEAVTFEPYFDSRRGRLTWRGFPSDHTSFNTQLSELATLVFPNDGDYTDANGYSYMHMGDIGTPLGVYTTWTKIKVISVDRKLREGGRAIYESIDLIWEDAEV